MKRFLAQIDYELEVPKGWGLPILCVAVPGLAYVIVSAVMFFVCWNGCKVVM